MKKGIALILVPIHVVHLIFFLLSKSKKVIRQDLKKYYAQSKYEVVNLLFALTFIAEFRGLFIYRLGKVSNFIKWLHPVCINLYIYTKEIGPGLKIQHGFSTAIGARSIGKNCWINQQVTIGYTNDTHCPTTGDNVTVAAGAIVIGDIIIGDNVIIGAGAVVTKSVPENCVVVGNPARIIKKEGKSVNLPL